MDRHPLLITEVLHNVFGRLNTADLLKCRKVCRLWKEISTSNYLLNYMEGVQIKFTPEDTEPGMAIAKYLEMVTDEDAFHYKMFYFLEVDLNNLLVRKLLEMAGENITTLKLFYENRRVLSHGSQQSSFSRSDNDSEWETDDSSSSSNDEYLSEPFIDSKLFYDLLFEQCPNLKQLMLGKLPITVKNFGWYKTAEKELEITKINIRQDYRTPKYSQRFLLDLFKVCPQLEEVRIETNYDSYSQDRILLEALVQSERIKTLKKLHLNSIQGESNLNSSLQYSQLQKLTINSMDFSFISGQNFTNLMSILSCTLNTLNLRAMHSFNGVNGFSSAFPPMKNLKKLRAGILFMRASFGEINYSIQFPKLKKLILKDEARNFFLDEWFPLNQKPHVILEELELPSGINNAIIMKRIADLFPNVTKLDMAVQTDKTLRVIWSGWPKLEELLLCINPVFFENDREQFLGLDSLLTGIPTELCQQILKNKTFGEVNLEEIRVASSISDLKFLRKLFIHSGPNQTIFAGHRQNGDTITDVSGYLALSKMSSLTKICLAGEADTLSGKCVKYICNQLEMSSNETCGRSFSKIGVAKGKKPIKWHSTAGSRFSIIDLFN